MTVGRVKDFKFTSGAITKKFADGGVVDQAPTRAMAQAMGQAMGQGAPARGQVNPGKPMPRGMGGMPPRDTGVGGRPGMAPTRGPVMPGKPISGTFAPGKPIQSGSGPSNPGGMPKPPTQFDMDKMATMAASGQGYPAPRPSPSNMMMKKGGSVKKMATGGPLPQALNKPATKTPTRAPLAQALNKPASTTPTRTPLPQAINKPKMKMGGAVSKTSKACKW
tara:strand:- start:1156 stop:1818 length:663 start_codon:yes stop_codon:yes gene_type:complete